MAKGSLAQNETAVLYLRMSDERQEHSIGDQRTELLAHAEKHGYRILREYDDPAISGDDTARRTGFLRMREDAAKGEFSVVLCWDQDRFGRFDPIEGGYWILPFRNAGVRLETIAQGKVDWTDFAGRLRYMVEQEGKHAYLRDLSRNVLRGVKRAAEDGSLVKACYGYRVVDGSLVVEPNEAKIVRLIFRLYLKPSGSLRGIADRLNGDGIPSPRGGSWGVSGVQALLMRRKYTGVHHYGLEATGRYHGLGGGEIVLRKKTDRREKATPIVSKVRHPAIIDEPTFERVQRLLDQRKLATWQKTAKVYLLSGLIRCADCGSRMNGRTEGKRQVYICSGYAQKGTSFCSQNTIVENPLVEAVVRLIEKRYLSEPALDRLRHAIHRKAAEQAKPDREIDAGTLRKKIKRLDKQITTGTERVFTAPERLVPSLYAKLDQIKVERDRLHSQLQSLTAPREAKRSNLTEKVEEAIKALRNLRQAIHEADPADARELLRGIVSEIELSFDTRPAGRYKRSTFREGVIHVRPEKVSSNLYRMDGDSRTQIRTRLVVGTNRQDVLGDACHDFVVDEAAG